MAIVMDMSSGEVEMRFNSDASQEGPSRYAGLDPMLDQVAMLQLGLVQDSVAPIESPSIPDFLISIDIETFLQAMHSRQ